MSRSDWQPLPIERSTRARPLLVAPRVWTLSFPTFGVPFRADVAMFSDGQREIVDQVLGGM